MFKVSRGAKKRLADGDVSETVSKTPKVTFLGPSHILLEIPADANTSLPVWDAMRSQQFDVAWTVNPYSIGVRLTPVASKQEITASGMGQPVSVPSSGVLDSHVVIKSLSQQSDVQQNPCILLTFPHNATQSLMSPPTQPVAPLCVPLPLIITQLQPTHQPSTPLPTTPTKLQAPSKEPVPSPFHTKTSSNIHICDDFLLTVCRAGKACTMHHTPYPFHWQLWCVITHQWVDVPSHSQALLERNYCNVRQKSVSLRDGIHCYTLTFDSMELDNLIEPRYDAVRRLTNSDSLVKNPHFPSKWKIYWWNNVDWEEYNKDASALLLKKMSEKESECRICIGDKQYKVDFRVMIQTNVTTGFDRAVRCRPFYRSPDSMRPYLQTGIQTESHGDPPAANFSVDPLEEFSSWYPPVWCLDGEQDYSLVDLPAGTRAYQSIQSVFYESLSETKVDIVSIQQVQNLLHWDKYQRHKVYMQKKHASSEEPLERHLFHGTAKEPSEDICHNNFDPRIAGAHGASNGLGSYFAAAASYSHFYAAKSPLDEVRHMFLAKVLVGKLSLGRNKYRRPPPLNHNTSTYHLHDTCVDDVDKPTMFVVFDSCQCYPYYLIKYKDLPGVVDIS